MKGIIINIFEDFVSDRYGDEFLERLYSESGLSDDVPPFIGPQTYPDSDLEKMLQFVIREQKNDKQALLFDFGVYALPVMAKRYPVFFEQSKSTGELLSKLNDIHHLEVKKLYPDAELPVFDIELQDTNAMTFHYASPRKMCSFAFGMITGAGNFYGESVDLKKIFCMLEGDEVCV